MPLLKKIDCNINDEEKIRSFKKNLKDTAALADEIGCGEITLRDILDRLR